MGLSPYNAPGVFSLLAATELTDGVWYPRGGFDKIRQGLQKLADEEGVTTKLGAEVAEIVCEPLTETSKIKGSKAKQIVKGVRLESGEFVAADVVVANPDLPCVWDQMIAKETFPEAQKESDRWENADYRYGLGPFTKSRLIVCSRKTDTFLSQSQLFRDRVQLVPG